MKRSIWRLVPWSAPFLLGCVPSPSAPPPPLDTAAPARVETATFALG